MLILIPKMLEPVGQFRISISPVCKLANEHRERFGVTGDPQGAGVHRIETNVEVSSTFVRCAHS
jgi:hypothetical protein